MRVFIFSVAIAILGLSQAQAAQKSGMVNARAAWFMPAKEFQAQIDAQTKPSQCDVPPKVWRAISPAYPPSRRSRRESGYALVEFTINERGRTCDIRVLETSFKYFGNYAVLAIQDWRFRPALKNGHPVPVHIRIPFHYRMKIATVGAGERFGTTGAGFHNSQDFVVGQALGLPNDSSAGSSSKLES